MIFQIDTNCGNRSVYFILRLYFVEEKQKNISVKCYSGDRGLELFNLTNLTNYWENFEVYVKPQPNQIMARYKLYCLKQLTQLVDLWITQAIELATEAGFDSDIRDEMLRDHIVFATNFETVHTKCLEVGDGRSGSPIFSLFVFFVTPL